MIKHHFKLSYHDVTHYDHQKCTVFFFTTLFSGKSKRDKKKRLWRRSSRLWCTLNISKSSNCGLLGSALFASSLCLSFTSSNVYPDDPAASISEAGNNFWVETLIHVCFCCEYSHPQPCQGVLLHLSSPSKTDPLSCSTQTSNL